MFQIIPAILATSEEDYQENLQKIKSSGLFKNKWVQIDFVDNKFVQNKSVDSSIIAKYPVDFNLEVHLMVEYPENWIDELTKIPHISRIIFPVEDFEGVLERIQHIKNHGKKVGLSINPRTPVSTVKPFLKEIDLILIMSVQPGFQGQEFITEALDKIRELYSLRSSLGFDFKIECDGGISEKNIREVANVGADIAVVGSGLLKYDNLEDGLNSLERAAHDNT